MRSAAADDFREATHCPPIRFRVLIRPRRNRTHPALRRLVRETQLSVDDLVLPLFVQEGEGLATPIASMPGHARLSIDRLVEKAGEAEALGIPGVALFPVITHDEKDPRGSACAKPDGLLQRSVRALKAAHPELLVITDVALDPYSSDGHDGVLIGGRIDNDETLRSSPRWRSRRPRPEPTSWRRRT